MGYDSDLCDICKRDSILINVTSDNEEISYCQTCYNKMMSELTDTEIPDIIPKQIDIMDAHRKYHTFNIEFIIFTHAKFLTAREAGPTKYSCMVKGELDEDFYCMWAEMIERMKRKMVKKYINPDGSWDSLVGNIEYNTEREELSVIVDGMAFTWEELKENVSTYEGWQIKIEFKDASERAE